MLAVKLHQRIVGHCEKCPLQGGTVVNGYGPRDARLAIVGEAPGGYEARLGRPFVGPSGNLIRLVLRAVGVDDEEEVYWTNSVLCRGAETANPSVRSIVACNDRLIRDELPLAFPQKVLCLGGPALTALLSSPKMIQITKMRGLGMMVDIAGKPTFTVPTYHPAAVLREQDLFRDLVYDLEKLLNNDKPMEDIPIELHIPFTPKEAIDELEPLLEASDVSCDLETTGGNPRRDFIISIGFGALDQSNRYHAVLVPHGAYNHPSVRRLVTANLERHSGATIFHNGKYDLSFLDRYAGRQVKPPHLADTMLLNYTLDERTGGGNKEEERRSLRTRLHSLKTICRVRYDIPNYNFDWEQFYAGKELDPQLMFEMLRYQARDCAYTLRLYHDLMREAEPENVRLHNETLIPASVALRQVERRGIQVDMKNVYEIRQKFEAERSRLQADINDLSLELSGHESFQPKGTPGINPSSSKQIQELIEAIGIDTRFLREKVHSERTKWSGTDKNSLHKMALQYPEHHPVRTLLQNIMAYRVINSSINTFMKGLEARIEEDGRVHGSFLLHGTVTGRLSSRDPNMQNFPNYGSGGSGGSGFASAVQNIDVVELSKSIRNSLVATPGYTLVEADFSQLELRILAYYTDDEPLKGVFIQGEDIHTRVASEIFGKPAQEISGEERRHGKVVDFGIVYGRSAAQIVGGPEMDIVVERGGDRWTIEQASSFLHRFFDGFPRVEPWLRASRQKAHTDHAVRSPLGRVRRLPLVLPDGHAERQAINSPIQSLASDICLHSLTRLVEELPKGAYVLSTIHDSILLEVRDEKLDDMLKFIREVMETTKPIDTPIPFTVDMKIGKKWGSMEKV